MLVLVLNKICLMFFCYSGSIISYIGVNTVDPVDEDRAVDDIAATSFGATISADGTPIIISIVKTAAAAAGGMYSGLYLFIRI